MEVEVEVDVVDVVDVDVVDLDMEGGYGKKDGQRLRRWDALPGRPSKTQPPSCGKQVNVPT